MQVSASQLAMQNNPTKEQNQLAEVETLLIAQQLSIPVQGVLDALKNTSSEGTAAASESAQKATNADWVPFTFKLPPGKSPSDVYVRVQGTDPTTGQPCYVTFDKATGDPTYHDITSGMNPEDYCVKLSDIPSTVNIPALTSGQMLFSVGKPLYTEHPDRNNTGSPDYNTKWSMVEFTNNNAGIWSDVTAVNSFNSPSIEMQMDDSSGLGPKVGYGGDPAALLKNVQDLFNKYAGQGSDWDQLMYSHGDISGIKSPKFDDTFNNYYTDYLQNSFLPYYQEGKGGHYLYMETRAGVLKGQVSQDGKTINFYDTSGKEIASLPTSANGSTRCWLTGAPGDWTGGTGDAGVQADLMRDLSAFVNSGITPETANLSASNFISKTFFENAKSNGEFYQASYQGKPMYDVYERAMHE